MQKTTPNRAGLFRKKKSDLCGGTLTDRPTPPTVPLSKGASQQGAIDPHPQEPSASHLLVGESPSSKLPLVFLNRSLDPFCVIVLWGGMENTAWSLTAHKCSP